MAELYDTIGRGYRELRRPDPRIAAQIHRALGPAAPVLNVGAGAGSYEPTDRPVVAVEPSKTMIRQRPADAAPVVQASGTALPFPDDAFGASMAVLTIHHWPDGRKGLHELGRAVRERVVILTCDPSRGEFWLTDYFPEILDIDRDLFPSLEEMRRELGALRVSEVPVPHDCADGFLGAYWRRPEAYLDRRVRSAISAFAMIGDTSDGLGRLARDLDSGTWRRRYGELLSRSALDLGYRLIVAG